MKVVSAVFFAIVSTASAFVVVPNSARVPSMSLQAGSKEEDLELTRKVIQDFEAKQSGEAAPVEEAPKAEEPVAAAAEE